METLLSTSSVKSFTNRSTLSNGVTSRLLSFTFGLFGWPEKFNLWFELVFLGKSFSGKSFRKSQENFLETAHLGGERQFTKFIEFEVPFNCNLEVSRVEHSQMSITIINFQRPVINFSWLWLRWRLFSFAVWVSVWDSNFELLYRYLSCYLNPLSLLRLGA